MKLENNFTIDAPVEKAWAALNSPETVAPCFPGATLTEYEGDSFTGTVKVKLGPIAMTYKGKGTYVSRDEAAHEVVIDANGKDSRGNGTAKATVTASLAADGPDRTAVSMVTDMTITGKPAQFGRGVISDVADKIIGQFAACVARKLAPAASVPVSATAAQATDDVPAPTLATASTPVAAAPSSTPGPAEGTPLPSTNGVAAGNPARDDSVAATSEAGTSEAEVPASTTMTPDVPSTPASAGTASTGTASAGTAAESSGGAPSVPATPTGTPAAVGAPATASTPTAASTSTKEPVTPAGTSAAATASATSTPKPATPAGTSAAVSAPATPRAPVHSEVDAIDLLDTAGAPVLKRLAPVAGGAVLLLLVVLLVRRLRGA